MNIVNGRFWTVFVCVQLGWFIQGKDSSQGVQNPLPCRRIRTFDDSAVTPSRETKNLVSTILLY